ncbi:hypothetical protein C7S18_22715 [Ahniella affigens]|uniref:CDP-glycerol--poly(Glycerophosphate) glycerophosphotransferase n=1 Tax=Ahniella affigens TaxID=2021234 RepID=A0A2P1PYB0_9GAMM|nr:CDP-glycerol glycerophosphotransferase family protein [Ahniella affigens]AVP99813.1 hypothetical protein C7S18_22715 [Ahniella affigens]
MRVAYFYANPFHHAMLAPVETALGNQVESRRFSSLDAMREFAPDVVVLAENPSHQAKRAAPNARIVWTRHGFANKRYLGYSMAGCDYACLSSAWLKQYYRDQGLRAGIDEWVTGFVPMDALYRRLQRAAPRSTKTLLYAPTFNPNMASVRPLGKSWASDLRRAYPELNIVIKPHPHTAKEQPMWLARWQSWAEADSGIQLIQDGNQDVYELMPDADILLTDASSVMFYFLALDRPIILVDNPLRFEDRQRFKPDAEEWAWRDIGQRIETGDALTAAVASALETPSRFAEARQQRAQQIFGDLFDGRAAERVAQHILALA